MGSTRLKALAEDYDTNRLCKDALPESNQISVTRCFSTVKNNVKMEEITELTQDTLSDPQSNAKLRLNLAISCPLTNFLLVS